MGPKRGYAKTIYDTGLRPLQFTPQQLGTIGTSDFRVHVTLNGKKISPWHDIKLSDGESPSADRLINMVLEIPKGTRAKMEMLYNEEHNPIGHDKNKDGTIRYMGYAPVLYNYGFVPQTWEDPEFVHPDTGLPGDGDPIDIIDIGYRRREMGEVYRVKVVGSLALIDQGETDWKVLAIALDDPMVNQMKTVEDIEKWKPGITRTLTEWYQKYKTADGKPENTIAFGGKVLDAKYTFGVLDQAHQHYQDMLSNSEKRSKYAGVYNKK